MVEASTRQLPSSSTRCSSCPRRAGDRRRDHRRRRRTLERASDLLHPLGIVLDHAPERLERDASAGLVREQAVGVVGCAPLPARARTRAAPIADRPRHPGRSSRRTRRSSRRAPAPATSRGPLEARCEAKCCPVSWPLSSLAFQRAAVEAGFPAIPDPGYRQKDDDRLASRR